MEISINCHIDYAQYGNKKSKISKIMFRSELGKTVIFLKDPARPLY